MGLVRQESDGGTATVYIYDANGNLLAEETVNGKTSLPADLETITGSAADTETTTGSAIGAGDAASFAAALETVSGPAIRRYTYDGFNRLATYQSGDTFASYTYNAEDYRITKQVINPDGGTFTRYFYEGSHVTLEADAAGDITVHNTYGINLASRTAGGEGYYYFYNAHGDVMKLVGVQSGEETTYRYDAFGTLIEANGEADNSITYAGYQYDAESGLYYLNARYYDSTTARFLTEDTYGGSADDPLSLNRYTYCANNPLRYTPERAFLWGGSQGSSPFSSLFYWWCACQWWFGIRKPKGYRGAR